MFLTGQCCREGIKIHFKKNKKKKREEDSKEHRSKVKCLKKTEAEKIFFFFKTFCFEDLAKSETPPLPSCLAPMCIFLTRIKYFHVWDSDKKALLCASVSFIEALILAPSRLRSPKRLWWPCGGCGGFALPISCFPLQQKELRWWELFTDLRFCQPPLMVEALLMACFSLPPSYIALPA